MRPRKDSFGIMKYDDFKKFAIENFIWGRTVKIDKDILTYTYALMFRDNKRPPEEIKVIVSDRSKNVIKILSDKREFSNINDALTKMRKP